MKSSEILTRPAGDFEVPALFARLRDIVYNLWWSWSPDAEALFSRLSPAIWQHYHNPIDVLIDLGPERWHALADDAEFARAYHSLVEQFDAYMNPGRETWFARNHPDYAGGPVAYFSTEFGWHESLQSYSGGLGVLSGDHSKSASDLGLPFVGVGLLYKNGYFRQTIDAEGLQQHFYPEYDLGRLPLRPVVDAAGDELQVAVEFPGRTVFARVWKVDVGRVPVLLLDSDHPINHPGDRAITKMLYVNGREMRLCQELLLGVGGARAVEALGIEPAVWHLNEGHSALLCFERMRRLMNEGLDLEDARRRIRRNTIFTTHTPVPAGNEAFEAGLVAKYLGEWAAAHDVELEQVLALGRSHEENAHGIFNLTALALRSSARSNGVSKLHGEVANGLWQPLLAANGRPPIEHVTNGVHPSTWVGPEIDEIVARQLGPWWVDKLFDDEFVRAIDAIPGHELWAAHLAQKRRLVALIREITMFQFARHGRSPDKLREADRLMDPELLTVGFARRFATYKRADLILRDIERLVEIVDHAERPVQFVFAGKAHPADRPGQDLIRRICEASAYERLRGRLVFLESYDMRIGRHLVQGVDLWLNTPRRPNEASGTSGMKAAMNGVLNCSILDGWWCEGYDPGHGWIVGNGDSAGDESAQDAADADALYGVLSGEIADAYYDRDENGLPVGWLRRMKQAMLSLTPRFSTTRMVREYAERYYLPAGRGELEIEPLAETRG